MAEVRPSRLVPVLLIVLVVIVAGVGAGVLYEVTHPKPAAAVRTVQVGDNVTVNYIGAFGSGPQNGRVFDTSLYRVAVNNQTYPKSLEFALRSPISEYTPLAVYVGGNAPSGGYPIGNLTFGGVVTGFWQGLLGLPVNQTRTIVVPPNLGYGSLVTSCLVTLPLATSVPVLVTVPPGNFSTLYPNVSMSAGTEFRAAPYNWTAVVLNVNATAVTVENLPTVGESVVANGLGAVVSAISRTTISVAIQLLPANAGLVLGHSATSVCGSNQFIVQSVNSAGGSYVANFNHEVVGQTLTFTVTVVQFY
jgi:FKBP-type peptidyl-prolyl cis-trans isomerase 2